MTELTDLIKVIDQAKTEGKEIRRAIWPTEDKLIFIKPEAATIEHEGQKLMLINSDCFVLYSPRRPKQEPGKRKGVGTTLGYVFSQDDKQSSDWHIVE